ncbi:ribosomal protein S3 [Bradyrhizobium diazoefficiens]
MRQQVHRRLAIADEIVVDEIDRVGHAAFAQAIELGDDLLRRLDARVAAVEAGDVAELALIGTAA